MTKAELMIKAQSLGLIVKRYQTKEQIAQVIEAHETFVRTVELMSKRPRRGL